MKRLYLIQTEDGVQHLVDESEIEHDDLRLHMKLLSTLKPEILTQDAPDITKSVDMEQGHAYHPLVIEKDEKGQVCISRSKKIV